MAAWIFVVALAVRLVVLSRLWNSPFGPGDQSDMQFYQDWAGRILHGQWTDHQAFIAMPGYPFFLAAVYRLAGVNPWLVASLNAVSESLIAVLLFVIARRVFEKTRGGVWIGILAALGWIFYEPAQVYSLVLMPTSFVVLAFWAVVFWCIDVTDRKRAGAIVPWWHFLLVGVGIGIAAMFIATILFVVPLVVAAALWKAQGIRRPLVAVTCAIAGVFAGTSPCWMHNYFIAKDPVFLSAHAGLNFWIGNNPTSNGYPQVPPGLKASERGMLTDSFTGPPRWLHRPMKRAEISRFWSQKAHDFMREHPLAWLKIVSLKAGKFWSGYEYDDLTVLANFRTHSVTLGFITFGLLAIIGVPAAVFAVRESKRAGWIVAAILLHMAALMPVFVTERYRLAAAPGLVLLASFGAHWLWKNLSAHQWKPLAIYSALTIAVACWVTSPQTQTGVLALEEYNMGIQALAANDLDRAEIHLRAAAASLPDHPDVNASLGALALKRGNCEPAKRCLSAALQRDPQNCGALQNLAVIALIEHRADVAIHLLERATAVDPDAVGAFALLAKACDENGDRAGAIKAADKAESLRAAQAHL